MNCDWFRQPRCKSMQIFPTNRARDKRRKIIFHRSNRRMPTPSPVWDNEPKRDNSRCSRRSKRAISTTLPWHSLLFCATMSVIIIKSQSTSLFAFTMWLPPTVRRYMSDSVNVELFFFFGFFGKAGSLLLLSCLLLLDMVYSWQDSDEKFIKPARSAPLRVHGAWGQPCGTCGSELPSSSPKS